MAQVLAGEDGMQLIARADKALYAAKAGGRNCAYRHDGENVERRPPRMSAPSGAKPVAGHDAPNAEKSRPAPISAPKRSRTASLSECRFRPAVPEQLLSTVCNWRPSGSGRPHREC